MKWIIKGKYARYIFRDRKLVCEIFEMADGSLSLFVKKENKPFIYLIEKHLKRKTIKAACNEATKIILEYIESIKQEATE